MLKPLDGPSKQGLLVVTNVSVLEVKISASALAERKVVTLQPLNGKIRVFFADDGAAPSVGTVLSAGFEHPKKAIRSYEATEKQKVYIAAESGSVNVIAAERA